MVRMVRRHPVLSIVTAVYAAALLWVTLSAHPFGRLGTALDAQIARGGFLLELAVALALDTLLFVPVGLLLIGLMGRAHPVGVLAVGALASCWLQLAQYVFAPGREPGMLCVLAEMAGVGVGIAIAGMTARPHRDRTELSRSLERTAS